MGKADKALERKANRQLTKLQAEESKLIQLQVELSHNPTFVQFLETQKQLQKKTTEFWDSVKQEMIDNSVKEINVDTDYVEGKLSVSYVKGYEATDISKVDKKYIVKSLDSKHVAQEVEKNGVLPKGVDEKGYYRLNKTLKTKDIVS